MKTRGRPKGTKVAKKSKAPAPEVIEQPEKTLSRDENPPRLFILPKSASKEATIVTLAHPRHLHPTRYYFCPQSGFYEFNQLVAPASGYKSWLLKGTNPRDSNLVKKAKAEPVVEEQPEAEPAGESEDPAEKAIEAPTAEDAEETVKQDDVSAIDEQPVFPENDDGTSLDNGYALQTPEIFTATAIDPLFLILPALSPASTANKSDQPKSLFLSSDDLFESLFEQSKHFREVIASSKARSLVEKRMAAISDTVDAGGEIMYRLSQQKLLAELAHKAKKVALNGLPKSMEHKFVIKPLEKPMMAVKREAIESTETKDATQASDETLESTTAETTESQSNVATPVSLETQDSISTTITEPEEQLPTREKIAPELLDKQRLRIALEFIVTSYLPLHLSKTVKEALSSESSPIDFKTLDTHIAEVARLKAEAAAQRSSVGDFSLKRTFEEEDAAEDRAEKKRKKEEEEKKKKAEPRGIKDLKKADISGMKKMSDFFKKAPAKKDK